MKTLLMIGGGLQQVRAIEIAKRHGYHLIVADRNKNCACSKIADDFYQVDGRDTEALISLGLWLQRENKLHGVFTFTELVTSVAAIVNACGLVGASLASAVNCQDKGLTKKILLENAISTPRGGVFSTDWSVDEILSKVSLPLIVKPVVGSGGYGMKIFCTKDEFDEWHAQVSENINYDSRVVIEEVVGGSSHDVNGIFDVNGEFYPYGIVDRDFLPDSFVENSIFAPSALDAQKQRDLYGLLESSSRALGINQGPVKGDAMLQGGVFQMLEVAPRLHGPKFSLYAMPAVVEDYFSSFFSVITGGGMLSDADLKHNGSYFKSQIILASPGKIMDVEGLDLLEQNSLGDLDLLMFKNVGDTIVDGRTSHDACGYIMSVSDSHEAVGNITKERIALININTC
jgi:biotin carboxylase